MNESGHARAADARFIAASPALVRGLADALAAQARRLARVVGLKTTACNLSRLRAVVDAAIADWSPKAPGPIPNGYAGSIAAALWLHLQGGLDAALGEESRSHVAQAGAHPYDVTDPLPGGSTVARCAARDRHGRGHQASAQVTPLTTPEAVQALMERLDKERKAAKVFASMGNAGARHVLPLLDDMGATIRALVEQDVHYDALANRLVGIGLKEAERRIHGWTLLVRRAEDAEAEVTRLRAALAERRE
jgi:hypothetical protein